MQIRSPAPLDRLKDVPDDEFKSFQHFDVMHVKNKFSILEDEVAVRLGKMITRRRFLLRYRRAHQERIRDRDLQKIIRRPVPATTEASVSQSRSAESVDTRPHHPVGSEKLSEATKKILKLEPLTPEHTFTPNIMQMLAPLETLAEDAESITSDTASEFTRECPVTVPQRPKDSKGEFKSSFECWYCRLAIHIQGENQDRIWR